MKNVTLRNVYTGREFSIVASDWDDVYVYFSESGCDPDDYEVYAPDEWYEN